MTTLNLSPDEISDLIASIETTIASTAWTANDDSLERHELLRAKLVIALRQSKRKAEEQMALDL